MSSYVQRVLQPGETVAYAGSIHGIIYLPALVFLVIAIGLGALGFSESDYIIARGVAGLALLVAVIQGLRAWFTRWTTEIAVTDRRIIYKRGFIRRHTIEMNMGKVESVDVSQSILGRIFNYGDILVRGTGAGLEPLRTVAAPIEFRNSVIAR